MLHNKGASVSVLSATAIIRNGRGGQWHCFVCCRHVGYTFLAIHWVTLTFAERFHLVFSLSGFANLSTKITTKQEFRLSSAE